MSEVIGRIAKTDTAEVRISRQMWKMRACVDIRVWYVPDGQSDYVATRKGVTIDAGKLPELIKALVAYSASS